MTPLAPCQELAKCTQSAATLLFQSFMEVRVERSKRCVVLILNGVDGPIHWRNLKIGSAVLPPDSTPDGTIVPMDWSNGEIALILQGSRMRSNRYSGCRRAACR